MPRRGLFPVLAVVLGLCWCSSGYADDVGMVKKAVDRITLDQPGTKPFHLKAVLAPSRGSEGGSDRTGEVEIWWVSPTQWRREVRSPEFHQIDVVNGSKEWQKNEGDYFPEWLRETAVALIHPVPYLDQVLDQVKDADVKRFAGSTYFSWATMSTDGKVRKGEGAGIAITDSTGLVFYGGDLGWGGLFKDYQKFNSRMVARTVSVGSPEVTARVTTLEDLRDVPAGFFDADAPGGDTSLLQTMLVSETSLRQNLLPTQPVVWPPLPNGPLEGVLTTEVVVDRTGKVRDVGTIVTDNPGLNEEAGKAIAAMQFKPYLQNGVPVQVVSRITMPFKTVRPTGVETFDSARNYFEHGRHVSFPAAGSGLPYVLHATFQARLSDGEVATGTYTDTWESANRWRREGTIGKSRYVRTEDGEKRYELAEGPDVPLLKLMMKVMEPIPAVDTFVESDWRIKRDTVGDVKTIRILTGYESPEGTLDPEQARGYWFDDTGRLVKTFFRGIETRRSAFENFGGVEVAQQIEVLHNGGLGMAVRVTDISAVGTLPADTLELPGHEYTRAFTDEVR